MFFSRVRIKDDRGKLVDVFDPSSQILHGRVVAEDPQLTDRIARIGAAKVLGLEGKLTIHTLRVLCGGLLLAGGLFFLNLFLPGISQTLQYLFIGSAIFIWSQFIYGRIRRESALTTVSTLLSEARCGSCAYNMSDTLEQDDHCIQCPECGSYWSSIRIQPRMKEGASEARKNDSTRSSVAESKNTGWNRTPTIVDGEQRALSIIDPTFKPPPKEMPSHLVPIAFRLIRIRTQAIRVFLVGFLLFMLFAFVDWTLIYNPTLYLQSVANRYQRQGLIVTGLPIVGLVFAFIFMPIIMYRIWTCRTQATVETVTKTLLELNLCPACGSLLPASTPSNHPASSPTAIPIPTHTTHPTHSSQTSAPSPQVPELTRCTHCAAAWSFPTPTYR